LEIRVQASRFGKSAVTVVIDDGAGERAGQGLFAFCGLAHKSNGNIARIGGFTCKTMREKKHAVILAGVGG
jgi:hypothetical protein